MHCGDQRHAGLCLGRRPCTSRRRVQGRSQGTTLSASDLHNARATILNPFYNMEYKIIKKIRQNTAWIEADILGKNLTPNWCTGWLWPGWPGWPWDGWPTTGLWHCAPTWIYYLGHRWLMVGRQDVGLFYCYRHTGVLNVWSWYWLPTVWWINSWFGNSLGSS